MTYASVHSGQWAAASLIAYRLRQPERTAHRAVGMLFVLYAGLPAAMRHRAGWRVLDRT